ncbi:MAG: glycoside hydrolase family 3 C-terminal domain-containing protein [Eubacteriales bacterium]|nr:glycoside hydrolase family 3 C-terminal domain-containing protein [Eubacteriales bacterium]
MNRKEARIKAQELVSRMTVEEKASQLKYDAPAIPRLGIPAYNWWNEALHGVARAGTATSYPQAIGMAAVFDRDLQQKTADQIATEARAKYNAYAAEEDRDIYKGLTMWSPNINIFRDPRWGRGQETYGEDPFLTKELGKAFVRGLQGDGEYLKTAACAKHFAVHSGPEAVRHEFDAQATPKDMEETYLPAFEALVTEADVEAVMGAYNRTNGEPCCGSKTLIGDILRGKWKFEGHFVSDCWAIRDFHEHHMVTSNAMESAAMALKEGCDLNCGNTYLWILRAYQEGLVTEEQITQAAVRLMTTRMLLGLMDGSEYDQIPYSEVESKEHLQHAEDMALKSIVLLKNDGVLPLDRTKVKTIGVVGPNADSRLSLIGNYHGTSSEYITLLEGVRKVAGEDIRILYSQGSDMQKDRVEPLALRQDRIAEAKIVAKHSDVVIVAVGLNEQMEGEEGDTGNAYASGDKKDLALPEAQQELIEAVAACGTPVIVCNFTGSAMDLSYAHEHCAAVLQMWYPGARGGLSAARLLFGEVSPSGKLPVTFYKDLDHMPEFEDYSMKGRTYRYMEEEAFYPFGYGLTYGKMETEAVQAELQEDSVVLHVTVENRGTTATEDVAEVYVKNLDSVYAQENHHLCGFKRLYCEAGEKKEIEITVPMKELTVVTENGTRLMDGSHYRFFVGFHQPDRRSVELSGTEAVAVDVTLN